MKDKMDTLLTYKIATSSFINALPLTQGIPKKDYKIQYHTPKECFNKLTNDLVHCALIPSLSLTENANLYAFPASCISSFGTIASVLLILHKPLQEIKKIGIDTRSTSAAALLKILCKEVFNISPQFISYNISDHEKSFDANLIIGNEALYLLKHSNIIDLGLIWHEWTHLPFVYALWAAKKQNCNQLLSQSLAQSKNIGLEQIDQICHLFDKNKYQLLYNYLKNQVKYDLNHDALTGLNLFFDLSYKHNIISTPYKVKIYDKQTL